MYGNNKLDLSNGALIALPFKQLYKIGTVCGNLQQMRTLLLNTQLEDEIQ